MAKKDVGKLDKARATEIEIKIHLDKLEGLNGEFQDLTIKLSNIWNDTEYAEHETDLSDADDRVYTLIESFAITDVNYPEAWNERYQNTREIVNAHIDRMLSEVTLHQESATGLRKLADTTTECRRSLELLEVPVKEWDAIIVNIISNKLDPDPRRRRELSLITDAIPTFEQLSSFIDQRARVPSTIEAGKSKSSKLNQQVTHRAQVAVHHGSTSTSPTCRRSFNSVLTAYAHITLHETANLAVVGNAIVITILFYTTKLNRRQHNQEKKTTNIINNQDVKALATKERQCSQILLPTALIEKETRWVNRGLSGIRGFSFPSKLHHPGPDGAPIALKSDPAWYLRFKVRNPEGQQGVLKAKELTNARSIWIGNVQTLEFSEEIRCMGTNQPLLRNSRLMNLNPYIDAK
ncbi:hypothetical protein CBL_05224 [Carabus blaptoides fortunei]